MQWLNHNQIIPSTDGRYVTLNAVPLMEAEKNTDWRVSPKSFYLSIDGPLKHKSGLGKPIKDTEQIFLLKDKRIEMNTDMHRGALGYAKPECDDLMFDDYDTAIKYALSLHRNTESSLWQYCDTKFELLHDFVGEEVYIT